MFLRADNVDSDQTVGFVTRRLKYYIMHHDASAHNQSRFPQIKIHKNSKAHKNLRMFRQNPIKISLFCFITGIL